MNPDDDANAADSSVPPQPVVDVVPEPSSNNKDKKSVRFADESANEILYVPNMRKFKYPDLLWWQRNELPSQNFVLRTLLEGGTTTGWHWSNTSAHDQARRIAHATLDVLSAQAKRGGGCASLGHQATAARHYQASMAVAPQWRGLESLIVSTNVQDHVVQVLLAQQQQQRAQQQDASKLLPCALVVQAVRIHSRPAAQLAMERARFDAKQVGQTFH